MGKIKKILKGCWDALEKPQIGNILKILKIITNIIFGASVTVTVIVPLVIIKGQPGQSSSMPNNFTIIIIIAVIFLIIIDSVSVWLQYSNRKKLQDIKAGYEKKKQEVIAEYDKKRQDVEASYDKKKQDVEASYDKKKQDAEAKYDKKRQDVEARYDKKRQDVEAGYGNKYQIIKILSNLQNKYILSADFISSDEYGKHSKEKDLKDRGEARIFTNSLNNDMPSINIIADNVTKGVKYTYVIPNKSQVLTDLRTFIVELHDKLFDKSTCPDPTRKSNEVRNTLEGKVEFWFFNARVPCLYNFARFHQDGVPSFTQFWWYVNPKNDNVNNYMLTKEIIDADDQEQLDGIFEHLKQNSVIKNASVIYEERDELESLYGGEPKFFV